MSCPAPVQAGPGVSLVPRIVTDQLSAEARLPPVADSGPSCTVSVVVRAGSGAAPALDALVLALRRNAGGDWARGGRSGAGRHGRCPD